jgi:hypothetical protein
MQSGNIIKILSLTVRNLEKWPLGSSVDEEAFEIDILEVWCRLDS